jgi:hypothetical protein
MRIRLVVDKTGPRWDGQDWPVRGGEIDVPDDEGMALCGQGDAVPVIIDEVETPENPLVASTEVRWAEAAADEPGESDEPAELESKPVARPIVNSPKADWVEHAVTQGIDRAEAEAMKKSELINRLKEG